MKKGFTIPEAVLNQLNECSTGFILFSVNEKGSFQLTVNDSGSPLVYSGLLNYATMQLDCLMEEMHQSIAQETKTNLDGDGADD